MTSRRLEGFDPVYGRAAGMLEDSLPCALLPFVFILQQANDGKSLRFHITDFHSNTWQTFNSSQQLEDLRDQVGIGGPWEEFLHYLRDAFTSENVTLILGGPASSIGGHGATTAKVVAQKCKGMPRISIPLEKLAGPPAEDAMGLIGIELLKAFKNQTDALGAEKKMSSQLKDMLMAEKEESRKLHQQIDTMAYTGRKRNRSSASQPSFDVTGASLSQFESKNGTTEDASVSGDSKTKPPGRAAPLRDKVHMAHTRRAKQRGSRLADIDEE